jgi:signal transduction histidine kinase
MRLPFAALLLATAVTASAQGADASAAKDFQSEVRAMLEKSMAEKKGIVLHVHGQPIGGGVIAISSDAVVVRNQEYGRIVIKLGAVDAVAGN